MSNRICKLFGISTPIVQAPIHTLTDGKMVAAVAEAGALGILGINSGFQIQVDATSGASASSGDQVGDESKFSILDTMTERNLMNEQIDTALENTFRPFAVEVASDQDDPDDDPTATALVALMRKRRITITLFEGFGHPISLKWISLFHENGIKIMEKVSNIKQAEQAKNSGVDVLVYLGNDLKDLISAIGSDLPVLAGNNMTTKSAIESAFNDGADGIFTATPFAVCEEAPTANNIKEQIVNAHSNELTTFRFPNGIIYSLSGDLPDKLHELTENQTDPNEIFTQANRYQGLINGMAKGNLKNGYTILEKDIDEITQIAPAEEIVTKLAESIPKANE